MKTNQVNRRNFLKLSATAGAVLALSPISSVQAQSSGKQNNQMPERVLGKTGMKVPILSMGVMRADNQSIVRAAYNSGVIFFDTANGYQNGRNEEMLGEFFADKPRNSFYIATKAKMDMGDKAAESFLDKFNTSMKRLKMEYVDILYIHALSNAEEVNYKPIVDVLVQLKKEGRVKFVGISTHSNEPQVIDAMIANGNYDVVLTSYNFSQKHLDALNPALERAVKAGLGVVAMKTMAGAKGVDAKAALKWALQNPNIHTAIPGYVSFDQLEDCLDAVAHLELNDEEKKFLSTIAYNSLLYCQGCQSCVGQCPERLPIPDLMRAYMYNYGYKNPSLAKETMMELALSENPCGKCSECKVSCISGFRVAEKVKDITRIQHIPAEFLV